MAWHGMASMSAINADHTEGWVCATHDVGVLTPSYSGMIQQAEQDRAACPCGMLYRIEYLGRPGHPPGLGPAPAPPRHSPESGPRPGPTSRGIFSCAPDHSLNVNTRQIKCIKISHSVLFPLTQALGP